MSPARPPPADSRQARPTRAARARAEESSEPHGHIDSALPQVVPSTEVERLRVIGMEVTDLGADHEHVTQLMTPPDGVARVGRRQTGPLAPLISPHLVAGSEVIPLRNAPHRVVQDSLPHAPTGEV